MKQLESDLYNEKVGRKQDVSELKSKIQDWEFKYTEDVDTIQTEYSRLLKFTDIERKVNQQIVEGCQKKLCFS